MKTKKEMYKEFFEKFAQLCPMTDYEFDELIEELMDYRDNELWKYRKKEN